MGLSSSDEGGHCDRRAIQRQLFAIGNRATEEHGAFGENSPSKTIDFTVAVRSERRPRCSALRAGGLDRSTSNLFYQVISKRRSHKRSTVTTIPDGEIASSHRLDRLGASYHL